jgi:hydrogenase expression/formation protein HypE
MHTGKRLFDWVCRHPGNLHVRRCTHLKAVFFGVPRLLRHVNWSKILPLSRVGQTLLKGRRTMTTIDMMSWTCPLPLRDYPTVVMGHGSGGQMSFDLVRHMFLPLFDHAGLSRLGDSTVLELALGEGGFTKSRFAVSTDSFTVTPLFFPGGDIGQLAIHGTVNDLAMSGATPLWLTAGFVLEEGLPMDDLGQIVTNMAAAARGAGVPVVAGDTKVVDRGHGDGVYINTTGFGLVPESLDIGPERAKVGDVILLSGTIGDHGVAVMSKREGLEFETAIESDTAALHTLVAAMLDVTQEIHVLRDPTRGGLASALNEIARSSNVGVAVDERAVPVRPAVEAACEMLGLDPMYVANEGKLIAFVPGAHAEAMLAAMRAHPLGQDAAWIGTVVDEHPGMVTARTPIGGRRVVDMQVGELLPRIC